MRGIHLLTNVLKGRYQWLGNLRCVSALAEPHSLPLPTRRALERLEREEEGSREFPPR